MVSVLFISSTALTTITVSAGVGGSNEKREVHQQASSAVSTSFNEHAEVNKQRKKVEYPAKKGRDYYEPRGDIVWEVPDAGKRIALTFDDGPDPRHTPAILNLLKQYEAKATFFVIGRRVKPYADIVRRAVHEGHEVGNHSFSHIYLRRGMSAEQMRADIKKAHESIQDVIGQKPKLFRPPGGYYNESLVKIVRDSGYRMVLWSWHQDTKDWRSPGVQAIVNKVVNNARDGDIVLLHDLVEGRTDTVEALKEILPTLKKRGYRFVTVSELLSHRSKAKAIRPN
ncbi:polysaccharide deacetylase family protein [Paenibacillus sp. 481]|nr:polysaccharide deacetylase family protein [Paenibacillus sp. 481]